MHPAAWLVWAVAAGGIAMLTTNPFYLLPLASMAAFVHAACRVPGPGARSFRIFALFGVFALITRTALVAVTPYAIGFDSVVLAAAEGLRLAVLLIVFGTFNSVSDPFKLLKLAPRRWHEPALVVALALSIAPRTIDAVEKVRGAQKMRGIEVLRWRSLPALAVPVLSTGMENALTLAASMDARGHGSGPRTRYRPDVWDRKSIAATLVCVVAVALFTAALVRGEAGLLVSIPAEWPPVDPLLLLACVALALPGLLSPTRT
ncbi:MAG TPA: energy-coupling factor transporter transmembrane component T [Actinomycetota bacterium]|nr:energy-coupling factor transporter transmembrane component T [Actinomycetota bacterium]